jgi:hypothetical protein
VVVGAEIAHPLHLGGAEFNPQHSHVQGRKLLYFLHTLVQDKFLTLASWTGESDSSKRLRASITRLPPRNALKTPISARFGSVRLQRNASARLGQGGEAIGDLNPDMQRGSLKQKDLTRPKQCFQTCLGQQCFLQELSFRSLKSATRLK